MLGLASFLNKLKDDTVEVIHRLRTEVGLSIKMITGDNIFTAVQTAFKSGIISKY
jgi:P-type E1-E2 ATPase